MLLDLMTNQDWTTRKVAIDAVSSLVTSVTEKIIPHRVDLLKALKPSRYHNKKPVRETALNTIKILKETQPPLDETELAILDDHPQR